MNDNDRTELEQQNLALRVKVGTALKIARRNSNPADAIADIIGVLEGANIPCIAAPDSMTLRLAVVADMKSGRLTKAGFSQAQRAVDTARQARESLQFLGFEFVDSPRRGR